MESSPFEFLNFHLQMQMKRILYLHQDNPIIWGPQKPPWRFVSFKFWHLSQMLQVDHFCNPTLKLSAPSEHFF